MMGEIGGMFFLLAFSMIVPWRLAMLYKYKMLKIFSLIIEINIISLSKIK